MAAPSISNVSVPEFCLDYISICAADVNEPVGLLGDRCDPALAHDRLFPYTLYHRLRNGTNSLRGEAVFPQGQHPQDTGGDESHEGGEEGKIEKKKTNKPVITSENSRHETTATLIPKGDIRAKHQSPVCAHLPVPGKRE